MLFDLDNNPLILDKASRWIDHLLDNEILQEEGAEPLLDASKVSYEIYEQTLVKLIKRNKARNNDNIDPNTPENERDDLGSNFGDGRGGRTSPTGSDATFIDVGSTRDSNLGEDELGSRTHQGSFNRADYDVNFFAPRRQLSHESRDAIIFSGDSPRARLNVTQPTGRERNPTGNTNQDQIRNSVC